MKGTSAKKNIEILLAKYFVGEKIILLFGRKKKKQIDGLKQIIPIIFFFIFFKYRNLFYSIALFNQC